MKVFKKKKKYLKDVCHEAGKYRRLPKHLNAMFQGEKERPREQNV